MSEPDSVDGTIMMKVEVVREIVRLTSECATRWDAETLAGCYSDSHRYSSVFAGVMISVQGSETGSKVIRAGGSTLLESGNAAVLSIYIVDPVLTLWDLVRGGLAEGVSAEIPTLSEYLALLRDSGNSMSRGDGPQSNDTNQEDLDV